MANKLQSLTCSMCLELFEKPKILPCFHSFCERCLQDLVTRKGGKKFPCPHCRRNICVPKVGVAGFQDNFYLDMELLEQQQAHKEEKRFICNEHPENELISVCVTCFTTICVECMLGSHKSHRMQSLPRMADFARRCLLHDKERLEKTLEKFEEKAQKAKENHDILADAVQSVRTEIHTKFAQLVSLAEKHRDEELARLEKISKSLDVSAKDAAVLAELQGQIPGVLKMREEIVHALEDGGACDLELIMLARETRFGSGSEQSLGALFPKEWPSPSPTIPVLKTTFSLDADISLIQSTIGNVITTDAAQGQPCAYSMLDKIRSALMFS